MSTAGAATRRDSFYGRRKGHALRASQADTLTRVLDALRVDTAIAAPHDLRDLFEAAVDDVALEIGFGGGEHLLHRASAEPATGRIGAEPFVNGMAKAAAAIDAGRPGNLRLFDRDAAELLDWLPSASLSVVDLLYPDPWHKRRHWKRRFVSPANLDRIARVLKPGGLFRFASDIPSYVDWTLIAVMAHPHFAWTAEDADDWRLPFPGWPGTRYEQKAIREGRRGTYLTFSRI
ncbi:tRNA (guanine-N7-)-methyltransferase [Kaistia soli DSM 19436]|uniref:tRNA (guanine-N(7)-)-methyltransferase n=1 Tax=Kaistia soli DSM 19436 TaxID=1122133 RepID=A0A1M5DCA4_9HYPH|nr:tRNA (guanine(46)-N(7))-methyltransferase TrmB [Kaistia soli]SHF64521.1 tRNA (guanine-N7-)-methyltransferase [Kaistia soli DSM 19436]